MSSQRKLTTRRASGRGASLAILVLLVLFGCTPSVVFYGDQALRAIVADSAEFTGALERAADEAGHVLVIEWDPSPELGTAWLENRLQDPPAPVIVLSPYFSLFASELADTYADLDFIGYLGTSSERANLTRVVFNRVPALEEAGVLVRAWEEAGTDRQAAALFLANSDMRRAELEALIGSYGEAGAVGINVHRFASPPDRETVRRAIRDLRADGVNAFLVFIGPSNRFALELLQSEAVVFATDFASTAVTLSDGVLFSIENRMEIGLAAALNSVGAAAGGTVVTADSVVEIGGAYANPQLGAPVQDESTTDPQDE